jgi:hypothetical protein
MVGDGCLVGAGVVNGKIAHAVDWSVNAQSSECGVYELSKSKHYPSIIGFIVFLAIITHSMHFFN